MSETTAVTTSRIKDIHKVSEFNSANGIIYYHHLEMENGDLIDIGKKQPMKIGWEVNYEVHDTQPKYHKAKSVFVPKDKFVGQSARSNHQSNFKPKTMNTQNRSFALSYAKDLLVPSADKFVGQEEELANTVILIAEMFDKWLSEGK